MWSELKPYGEADAKWAKKQNCILFNVKPYAICIENVILYDI